MINVLIPTDFSENAWNAIQYGVRFFRDEPVNFYLLHVNFTDGLDVLDSSAIVGLSADTSLSIKILSKLKKIIDRIEGDIENTGHKFYPVHEQTFFIDGIKNCISNHEIDFIVMGTKGASGLKEVTIGSRAGEVITRIKCPTLVIPENAEYVKPVEIAFPTDFNIYFKNKILLSLAEVIDMNNSSIRVLSVTNNEDLLSDFQRKNKQYLEDFLEDKPHSYYFLSARNIEDALEAFIKEKKVNMVAMVAKNLNFFQRLLFKPPAARISYHTEIPFLVLHE